jgi:GTP pyrophosphokinase
MPSSLQPGGAVTGRARAAIRRAARDLIRKQSSELGRRLLIARFERAHVAFTDQALTKGLPRLAQKSVEDVLVAVGRGELEASDVLKAAAPDAVLHEARNEPYRPRTRHDHGQGQEGWFNLSKVIGLKFRVTGEAPDVMARSNGSVPIRGLRNDIGVKFEEAGAVPGDRIVGVMMPGEGIKIFQIHSPKLKDYEHESWIDVTWDINPENPERFPARLLVSAVNEPGSLAEIAKLIGDGDGNIDNLRMLKRERDFTEMLLEVEVWSLEHLNSIIAGLRAKSVVSKVERVTE